MSAHLWRTHHLSEMFGTTDIKHFICACLERPNGIVTCQPFAIVNNELFGGCKLMHVSAALFCTNFVSTFPVLLELFVRHLPLGMACAVCPYATPVNQLTKS